MLRVLHFKDLTKEQLTYLKKYVSPSTLNPQSVYFLLSPETRSEEKKKKAYFGFAILTIHEKAILELIFIQKKYRFSLYGTQLMKNIFDYCCKQKHDTLYLNQDRLKEYKESQVFFQRLSFEKQESLWLKKGLLKKYKRYQQTLFVLGFSVIINTILTLMKLIVGYLSGSQGAIADGWQTLMDNLSSCLLFFTSYISYKEADKEHPFGHANVQPIASLAIGVWLISTAFSLALDATLSIWSPRRLEYPLLTLIVIAVSIFIKGGLYAYKLKVAKNLQDVSLLADALEHRADVFSSLGVLLGIYLSYLGLSFADSLAALLVSILIIKESYQLIKASADRLMNRQEEDQIKLVRSIVEMNPCVQNAHDIRIKYDGNQLFIFLDIRFPREYTLHHAHDISHKIEYDIKEKMHNVEKVFIHGEPTMK